jgi:ribose transport system substrate-binding protein
MERRPLLSWLLLIVLPLGGCGGSGERPGAGGGPAASTETSAKKPKGAIGLSVLTLTNPFFKEIGDTMTAEAAKHGYDVIVVSGENDVARQQNQVKDFIVKKVAAIVLTPCDSRTIGPAIQEANAAGIPVFTADIACVAVGPKVVAHVATDNYGGGREAAKAIVEALGGKGKVAVIDYPEVESVILRTKGFEEEMAEQNKKPGVSIQIVAKLSGRGSKDQGYKAAQDLLQSHSDLDGIFAVNDPSALGARAALENAGKADVIKIVGFDGQREGKLAIKAGKIYADPIQFPDQIGKKTVEAIVKHFEGEKVSPEILIPTKLYRKADAEADTTLK